MKVKILFLSIFLLLIGCKEYKYSKLVVKIDNANKNSGNLPLSELVIYKNGIFFKKIINKDGLFLDSPIKLDSIEKGNYEFEFYNLFGEKTKKQFQIENKKKIDTIAIFPDEFAFEKYSNKSIIKNLKNNSVEIKYNSQGCFHQISDSIKISNKNENYFILHKNVEKQIDKKQLENLIKFESQLYAIPSDGLCTTIENYSINFNNETKEIRNENCVWSGWSNLEDEILNKK
ncbi:hypothetical protein [Chryseobacterium sp. Leaf180]|uniref:hypothetical protein n=1 Tax=Chryseobacterium sp. Leaf180 TaxID=1736289 RepID=UPI000AD1F835|nr:hypothetical protein [Chryseobacterium sp. Leaf180]